MELPVARGNIVCHEISEYMQFGFVGGDMLRGVTDYDAEFDLIIELLGHPWINRIEWSANASGLLVEPSLVLGSGHAQLVSFLTMLGVIHADGKIFPDPLDRREQS